ncbi:unnamed protein product [Ixodes pacificus]
MLAGRRKPQSDRSYTKNSIRCRHDAIQTYLEHLETCSLCTYDVSPDNSCIVIQERNVPQCLQTVLLTRLRVPQHAQNALWGGPPDAHAPSALRRSTSSSNSDFYRLSQLNSKSETSSTDKEVS